jgi:methionyl-tRNA formyltransferase
MSDTESVGTLHAGTGINRIILLTNSALGKSLIGAILNFKPGIAVLLAETIESLSLISEGDMAQARLISFCSSHIVPPRLLASLGFGAYNIHPGPPGYPGWAPYSFALYDNVSTYGVTAHRMTNSVDAGPIVGVETFPVPPGLTLTQLLNRTNGAMFQLFATLAAVLVNRTDPLPELPLAWGGRKTTKRDFAERCSIAPDIAPDELARVIRAFGLGDGFAVPSITLHGVRFDVAL